MKVLEDFIENEKKLSPQVKFNYKTLEKYFENTDVSKEDFATDLGISASSVYQYLQGTKTPGMLTAIHISEYTNIPLDYFFITERNKNIDTDIDKVVIPTEITDAVKELLSKETREYIFKMLKENKSNKYKRILTAIFDTKVNQGAERKTYLHLLTENILDILVCAKLNDTSFMELFTKSANELSNEINIYKTKVIGNKNIDFSFNEIINKSNDVKHKYNDTKEILHNAIDEILETTLNKEFDIIKPHTKLL